MFIKRESCYDREAALERQLIDREDYKMKAVNGTAMALQILRAAG